VLRLLVRRVFEHLDGRTITPETAQFGWARTLDGLQPAEDPHRAFITQAVATASPPAPTVYGDVCGPTLVAARSESQHRERDASRLVSGGNTAFSQ
jgi:hypothetical protein